MKVDSTKDIKGIDRVAGREEKGTPPASVGVPAPSDKVTDKVTIEGRQVAELLTNAKMRTDSARGARLEQLEAAIKGGVYRPDAGQLAEKLLSAAEIDAKLRALMKG
jgi:anti-sigma28 factor (negative regulator of flagellin synthesis)